MPKLVKQKYTNNKGERKTYSYLMPIPKRVLNMSGIEEDDEVVAYTRHGAIIIEPKYHLSCQECGFEWEYGQEYSDAILCPRCRLAENIHWTINGDRDDN